MAENCHHTGTDSSSDCGTNTSHYDPNGERCDKKRQPCLENPAPAGQDFGGCCMDKRPCAKTAESFCLDASKPLRNKDSTKLPCENEVESLNKPPPLNFKIGRPCPEKPDGRAGKN